MAHHLSAADDGSLGEAFHLRVTPQHVVIGRDGRIQYIGHLADQRLEGALVAARAPAVNSRPNGGNTQVRTGYYRLSDRLPEISTTTLDGQTFHTQDSDVNRPTVLVFMDAFCEWYLETSRPSVSKTCRAVREQVAELAGGNTGVRWLGIASGIWTTKADLIDYRDKYKPGIPLTLDESGALFRMFQINSAPTLLIVNSKGKIVRRVNGFDAGLAGELGSIMGQ